MSNVIFVPYVWAQSPETDTATVLPGELDDLFPGDVDDLFPGEPEVPPGEPEVPLPSESEDPAQSEPETLLPDADGDGVSDELDNCLLVANADQADLDGDGVGDACDADADGVPDHEDNCPTVANVDQLDAEADGIGDVCDPDDDGDGATDETDNCLLVANTDQADADGNGMGDACEPEGPPDTEPPTLSLPAGIDEEAADTTGKVVTFSATATDDQDPAPQVYCGPTAGSMFPLGVTIVTCTATDLAGNVSGPGSFEVSVRSPPGVELDPTAEDDFVSTVQGTAVTVFFLSNDVVPVGTGSGAVSTQTAGGPANGSVQVRGEQFVYSPESEFVGSDRFGYTLCLGDRCDSATVTVEVYEPEGGAREALTEPVWQALAQRPTETVSGACQGALAWGGFANGRVPGEAMASIGGPHRLERTGAVAFLEMLAGARGVGMDIPLTDSYRSYEAQVQVRLSKGARVATATPGTSVHGWGKAIDVNLHQNSALRPWLEQNAVRFGWVNPAWAKRAGKSFEPWHYEFYGNQPGQGSDGCSRSVLGAASTQETSGAPQERIGADEVRDAGPVPGAPSPAPVPIVEAEPIFLSPIRYVAENPQVGLLGIGMLLVLTLGGALILGKLRRRR